MSVDYPYAEGPLLEDRNTYFYSAYGGAAFLRAWQENRQWAGGLAETPPHAAIGTLPVPEPGTGVETAALLESLMSALQEQPAPSPETDHWLGQLVKKFEVTKRIHAAYDSRFRTTAPNQHSDLRLYLRMAEVFEAAFARTGRLSFLNALLKILDTLSAYRDDLSADDRQRVAWLIGREAGHVKGIAEASGVAL